MSDTPQPYTLVEQVRWRWQIPLLAVALVLLAAGVWRLKPAPAPPRFEELYARAEALREAELYPEASTYITELLPDPARTPAERARLHRLMCEVIFAHEGLNIVHDPGNAQRIIEHSDKIVSEGGVLDASLHEMRGQALEWLKRPTEAVAAYAEAVAAAPEAARSWALRKRLIEIQRVTGGLSADKLHAEYQALAASPAAGEELRYWAVEQELELLEQEGRHAEAERFLEAYAGEFQEPSRHRGCDYLQALCHYRSGRLDEAERLLRSVGDSLAPGDPLFARSSWLLGKVLQSQEAPEAALGLFDDVVNNTTPSAYRTACIMGRGEALASLRRFSESIEAFNEAVRLTAAEPYGALLDLQVLRESASAQYQSLLTEGELAEAMGYLRIAARLVPPTDAAIQAEYCERVADLAAAIGKDLIAQASGAAEETDQHHQARRWLLEAGEEYLRLAKLNVLDAEAAAQAAWNAADSFDLAGQRGQTVAVLEGFIRDQPESPQAPMVLLRLGQACQATGEYAKAIGWYQRNLVEFPRTPAALASLVPLAECFLAGGDTARAETTLLRMVAPRPSDGLTLITPLAGEYREALFKLAELYARSGQLDKAIARYEEILERYPQESQSQLAGYLLADVYRRSAAQIRSELADPGRAAQRDELLAAHQKRLRRASELFAGVKERFGGREESSLGELDRLYLKLSYFYHADVVYDLSLVSPQPDPQIFAEAIELYDRAAWKYQSDPMVMSAYVQIINCHLRLGSLDKARMALQRARWTLKGIVAEKFAAYAPDEDAAYWEQYLSWLERTPTLGGAAERG